MPIPMLFLYFCYASIFREGATSITVFPQNNNRKAPIIKCRMYIFYIRFHSQPSTKKNEFRNFILFNSYGHSSSKYPKSYGSILSASARTKQQFIASSACHSSHIVQRLSSAHPLSASGVHNMCTVSYDSGHSRTGL